MFRVETVRAAIVAFAALAPLGWGDDLRGSNAERQGLVISTVQAAVAPQPAVTARIEPLQIPNFKEQPVAEVIREWAPPSGPARPPVSPTTAVIPDKPNEEPARILPMAVPANKE